MLIFLFLLDYISLSVGLTCLLGLEAIGVVLTPVGPSE